MRREELLRPRLLMMVADCRMGGSCVEVCWRVCGCFLVLSVVVVQWAAGW